jgi:methionyl-tRNA synthetase
VAVALCPVIPSAAQEIWNQLGCAGDISAQRDGALAWGGLIPGQAIRRGAALFPRIDKAAYFKETRMDQPTPAPPPGTPGVPAASTAAGPETITIDDFMKVKLRVGKILEAEKVAGADKLLKLLVDIGTEKRTVLAGIALQYAPETLVGKCVILVANLAPRKMRGIESQGMILAADAEGRPIVATFDSEVPAGATVR